MIRKNDYFYVLFVGRGSVGEVSGEELRRWFDAEAAFAIMDFTNARGGFTGQIRARVLAITDLKKCIEGYHHFRRYYTYWPKDYERNLRTALRLGEDPEKYSLRVDAHYPDAAPEQQS